MNILLIGLGNIGKIHLRNFLKFNDLNIYIYDTKSEVVNELVGPRVHLIENPLNNLKKIKLMQLSSQLQQHIIKKFLLNYQKMDHTIRETYTTISNELKIYS